MLCYCDMQISFMESYLIHFCSVESHCVHHELCASVCVQPHLHTLTSYTHFNANEGYTPGRNACENRHYIMLVPDAYYRRRNYLSAFFQLGIPICSHADRLKVFFPGRDLCLSNHA